jgi:hypothetical protein
MGQVAALTENDSAIRRFARRLRDDLGVERVLLFGDHLTGAATEESEYRLILIGDHFAGQPLPDRPIGLHEHFYDAGGDAPLDLICLTPEEFEAAKGRASLVRAILPEAIDLLAEEPAPA